MKPARIALGLAAALGTVAILITASECHSDKKEDRPSGPVATVVPAPAPLQAQEPQDNDMVNSCLGIMPTGKLAMQVRHSLHLDPQSGNSGSREQFDLLCNYHNTDRTAHGEIVAQTSFGTLASYNMSVYRAVMAGNTRTGLQAHKISASRLPKGVDDGFEFNRTGPSVYQNPGAMLRVNDQVVVISFQGFDKLSSQQKVGWTNAVVRAVVG
jgi:hypothetical protein